MYAERYPEVPAHRWAIIPNGYDEDNFADALRAAEAGGSAADEGGPLRLVHAGALYPSERDPLPFFRALSRLQQAGRLGPGRLRVVLRATGHDDHYRESLAELGLTDLVELAPGLPYAEALAEMVAADGLLLFQAANCNHQIPAKLYEYLRAQRPILALTDPAGDTATTLRDVGVDTLVPLDDTEAIERGLAVFLDALYDGEAPVAALPDVQRYSRRAGAARLAELFDEVTEQVG
jgi:glycosyltransferase involved in cell wall biosynthesis